MDLNDGPEYQTFREEVRRFLAEHADRAPPAGSLRDDKARAWQRLLLERGYAARTIPREYGGAGQPADLLKSRIIAEEFARARVSPGLGGQGISMLVPTLLEVGTEEQKRQFIPPTLAGEMIWCQGYSEPGAGSDLASAADLGGSRRRHLGDQRPEDLDQHGAHRRLDLLPGAHRARCAEAPGHQLPAVPHGHARHRGAAAGRHDAEGQLQRGVLHRRARAEAPDRRQARRRLEGRQRDPEERAQFARRSRTSRWRA